MSDQFRDQAAAFISETLTSEIPDVSVDPGSGTNNVLVRGGSVIQAAVSQELDHVLTSRDISDPEAISESDMDRNLGNLLVTRDQGDLSRGFVNVHFNDRRRRAFSQGARATTQDKVLGFVTESDLAFNESDYIVEPSDNTFYLRIPFAAERAGPEYDVDVGEINNLVDNRLGAVYISNPNQFRGGQPAQTNTEYLRMASRAVSTRLPINIDGTLLTLQKLFKTNLLDALIVGNGDPEMLRDELYDQGGGVLRLGPAGSPTGVHIGGRSDAYHWYPQVNYVEVTIDLTIDLVFVANTSPGAGSVQAKFSPGSTTTNTVPDSGSLVLELGGAAEETVSYSSFTLNTLTGVYTFTLTATTTQSHLANAGVKIAGTGAISVGVEGAISTLPILKVASVRLLDPLTLTAVGEPLNEVTPEEKAPGWYFENMNKLDFMSAKETRTLRIAEKKDIIGNAALSGTDGVTALGRLLSSATTDFTGYQGRDITISDGVTTVTRVITTVVPPHLIEYADGPETLANGSGRTFSVDAGFGDFLANPIRVGFYTHTQIQDAQAVFDGGRVRVISGNVLSRAFLPMFLDFTLSFRGPGTAEQVSAKILELIQQSQGSSLGSNQGAEFDVSDIVNAAYSDALADFVQTPFEVKVTYINADGTKIIKWVSPDRDTVNDLVISSPALMGDVTVTATRPIQVPESAVPERGNLFLGAYVGDKEKVTYERVAFSGSDMIFVLTDGTTVQHDHDQNEPLRVSVRDFDPDNVITDGTISAGRQLRPYFGTVVVEKLK